MLKSALRKNVGSVGKRRRWPESEHFFHLAMGRSQAMLVISSIQPDAARRKKGRSKPDRVFRQSLALLVIVLPWLSMAGWAVESVAVEPHVHRAQYRGWDTQCLSNGLIEVHVVPEIGGRIVQFKMGDKAFLWVNPDLAGKLSPASGLSPDGEWLNYGGDKLWPAPQGWDNDNQWPGPPDAVLDGQPYTFEVLPARPGEAAVRLTSRPDPRSGIQFSRAIRIFANTTRVAFEASMKNVDTRPRRWGIWAHTQLDATEPDGRRPNRLMKAWCPVNPQSRFTPGYQVIFGTSDNPSFHTDWRRGLVEVNYCYQVGKIAVDSHAGWSATVNGINGAALVQGFTFEPDHSYPDHASVEFWLNGSGKIHAYNQDMEFPDDPNKNPYVFESELLSPFCEMQPGDTYTWHYDWHTAHIGGDYPVVDCTEAGVVAESLQAEATANRTRFRVSGRFGVFAPGKVRLRFLNAKGTDLKTVDLEQQATPLAPLILNRVMQVPDQAKTVELVLVDPTDRTPARLGCADLPAEIIPGKWSREKAWDWYQRQPWLIGCNFLPSTVVNDVEMWQAETFDIQTMDRELRWASSLGFNLVRVFLNYVAWQADPEGFKTRFARFLEIAHTHQIGVMPILMDDCNFANRVAVAGQQPAPIPGVHNSQWVSSPPLAMVTDQQAWPGLKRYTQDILGTFARDRRVTVWDLYNEPGNSNMHERSLPLVESLFAWAREARPGQPLTVAPWADMNSHMSRRLMELSDVVSFHGYDNLSGVRAKLAICRQYHRPIFCTEWLHRPFDNTVEAILPVFQAQGIGCTSWGLVYGRTQTYLHWGSKAGDPVPDLWQHDLFHPDGTPYRPHEVALIRKLTRIQ